jgi:SsrA-binding protein
MNNPTSATKVVAFNRKASHEFFLENGYIAGIALQGTEIKSIRAGQIQLLDAFVQIIDGEVWLYNAHIAVYQSARENHEPKRPRKLLMHKREIAKLQNRANQSGYSIVPIKVLLQNGLAKIEIAPGKGKKSYDKRDAVAKRDSDREIAQALARRR